MDFFLGWLSGTLGAIVAALIWLVLFSKRADARVDSLLKDTFSVVSPSGRGTTRPDNETARKFNDPRYRSMKEEEFRSKAIGGSG